MSDDVSKYTLAELKKGAFIIKNYEKTEKDGIITISYRVSNRARTAIAGTAVGATIAIGVTALFPPAGLLVMGAAAIGTELSGTAIGAALGDEWTEVRYFDGDSKLLLGSSRTEAANAADQKGTKHFNERRFAEAKGWFHKAFAVCNQEQEQLYKKKENEAEAEILHSQGMEKFNRGDYNDAKDLFERALNICQDYEGRSRFQDGLKMAEEKVKNAERTRIRAKPRIFQETSKAALSRERKPYREKAFTTRSLMPDTQTLARWGETSKRIAEKFGQKCEELVTWVNETGFPWVQITASSLYRSAIKPTCNKAKEYATSVLLPEFEVLAKKGLTFLGSNAGVLVKWLALQFAVWGISGLKTFFPAVVRTANLTISSAGTLTKSSASNLLIAAANFQLSNKHFEKAKYWYRKAMLFTDEKNAGYLEGKIANTEAECFNNEGEKLLALKNYAEAEKLFLQARSACGDNYHRRSKFEENLEKIKAAVQETEELFRTGEKLWNNAWTLEDSDKTEIADEDFTNAKLNFEAVLQLFPNNEKYVMRSKMAAMKIEGNRLFNEGIALHEKSNELFQQNKYQDAYETFGMTYDKYKQAKMRFEEGLSLGDEERFGKCIDLVTLQMNAASDRKDIADRDRFVAPLSALLRSDSIVENDEMDAVTDDSNLIYIKDA